MLDLDVEGELVVTIHPQSNQLVDMCLKIRVTDDTKHHDSPESNSKMLSFVPKCTPYFPQSCNCA